MDYWKWLFKGSGAGPGIRAYLDLWIIFHLIVGVLLSSFSPVALSDAAKGLLLPIAGIFIGLSFAWGGNAQALLETNEIRNLVEQHPGGFEEYVYMYQSAILFILITLVLWGIAGLEIFDRTWPTPKSSNLYFFVQIILFSFASISIRECWHVVLGAQWFLLARYKIKKNNEE